MIKIILLNRLTLITYSQKYVQFLGWNDKSPSIKIFLGFQQIQRIQIYLWGRLIRWLQPLCRLADVLEEKDDWLAGGMTAEPRRFTSFNLPMKIPDPPFDECV